MTQHGKVLNKGTEHFHSGNLRAAERCYRAALRLHRDYAPALYNLGVVYDERGNKDAALRWYLSAIRADPEYADAHYNLALLLQESGRILQAWRHWKQYLSLPDKDSKFRIMALAEFTKLKNGLLVKA